MKITIEVKNARNFIEKREVSRAYLTKFVNPNQEYPVTYTIKQDGTKVYEPTILRGEDLTENQIAELFSKELL